MPPIISLRPVKDSDLGIFFHQQSLPEACLLAGVGSRNQQEFFDHWHTKVLGVSSVVTRAILVEEQVAGYALSWEKDDRRLVGYWLGKEFWGKGIASVAFKEFLKELPWRPLYAHVALHNVASAKILEKSGFEMLSTGRKFSKAHSHEIDDRVFICR